MTDQYAEETRWVFSFGLEEESEDECQREESSYRHNMYYSCNNSHQFSELN